MKLFDLDTSTRMVVYLAMLTAKAKGARRRSSILPKLQKAVAEFEKAHEDEMLCHLMQAIGPNPRRSDTEYCDMCDGTGLMEGWNRRDGTPCPKCHGAAVLAV